MKHGHVNVNVVKVILKGSAGVGKTCLTHLLLDKPPPQERQSTGCAERSIRVIQVGKEGGQCNEISTNKFQKIIAEAVPVLYKELERRRRQRKRLEDVDKVLSNLQLEDEKKERRWLYGGGSGGSGSGARCRQAGASRPPYLGHLRQPARLTAAAAVACGDNFRRL